MRRRDLLAAAALHPLWAQPAAPDLSLFFRLLSQDSGEARQAMEALRQAWRSSYAIMIVELMRVLLPGHNPDQPLSRAEVVRSRLLDFLSERTAKSFGTNLIAWSQWAWSLDYDPHPDYAAFKGVVYGNIDPRMREFFPPGTKSTIRLDQVEWGGVSVNGIPPLVNPAMIAASEAGYLKDSHAIFGVALNGEAKAYPKRILAWHEMARDTVGGVDLAIVYCTLCGTVIPYRAEAAGRKFTLGTSGFLYESSKLMFDEETKSLWPTLQGRPAIGPLAGADIQLEFAPVVTTTWGEWRTEHPATKVLSPETGHDRDYSEGAAYRDYFGTDRLMFQVSRRDSRLKNKDEVLVIRLPGKKPLAIAAKLLAKRKEFQTVHEGTKLEVRTSAQGANRVFVEGKQIPAHRAFWFGWYAQFPETVLLK